MTDVPENVVEAVNCMLRPYGLDFSEMLRRDAGVSDSRYMTARQASEYCGLAAKTIRDKALAGEFRSIKLGNSEKSRVLIRKCDLDNWLEGFSGQKKQQLA